jgi:hypothetical protein
MTETTQKPDITESDSGAKRKDSGNTLLTIKLMIIASVVLGVLWILDAMFVK